ncbi:MAG TPA: TonB-dependent receptor, partial [Verrucomicrobiae bacterium]|nr:TonB-dependent receptor [Verrucomicrobiae bacterium]
IVERFCGGGRTTPLATSSPNADCRIDGRSDSSGVPVEVATTNYRWARDGRLYGDFVSEYGVLTATADTDMFDVTSITGYYHFRQTDLNNVAGEGYPATFSQFADFEQFSQEVRVQSDFDGPLNVLFGGFISTGEFIFNTDAYIFPVPLDVVNDTYVTFKRDNGFETESASLFAQAIVNFSDQWELSAGGRYSWETRDSYQRSLPAHIAFAGAFPGGIELLDRYDDQNFSPELTLRYKPSADTTWYIALKEGFKAGGFNISQALSPLASVELGRFGAETALGGEIGLRTLALDRRLALNITAFHYLYEDLQVQFFDPNSVSLTAGNAGELVTQGIEADFNYSVPGIEGLSLRGAAAWNDVQYQDYIGQCYPGQTIAQGCNLLPSGGVFNGQDYDGLRPPKAPEYAARLGFSYETPITASGISLRWNGDASYTSEYNFSDALRPDAVQDAFVKYDTAISLVSPDESWTLSLIGRNLSDELVITAGNDIPFAGGTGTGTAGPGVLADMSAFIDNPREIYLEFSWRY